MGYQVKQSSTAYPLVFLMVDSTDHVTAKTGLSPTVTISKAGGSFGSPSGSVTEIANGWYKVAGNATDTATLGPLILHATGTAADPVDILYEVVAFDPQDSVRLGLTALPNAAAEASGGLVTRGTGTGQITVSSGAVTVGTNSDKTGYSLSQSFPSNFASLGINASGHISRVTLADTITTYTGNTVQTGDSYARIGANGASLTSLATQASVNTIDDFLDTEIAAIKAKTDNLPASPAATSEIQTGCAAALTAYDPPTNAEMEARTIVSASYATATDLATVDTVVDAIKVKTDYLPSQSVGVGGGLAGHTTLSTVSSYVVALDGKVDVIDGIVDTVLVDTNELQQLLTTAMTESYATDGSQPTFTQFMYMIWSAFSQFDISSTTITSRKLDGTTSAMTFTMNDATSPTSRTRAT